MSHYPAPEFSMLPSVRRKKWQANRPVIANVKTSLPISYARNGLAIIAKALLAPGSKVLLPAYHCPALVEPFMWAQCEVYFYPLNNDLSPTTSALTDKIPTADAIVLVPFFGFEQDLASLAELARKHKCLPIYDLAHAAHTNILHGDYGVTSLQKFYPIATGGELLIANSVTDTRVVEEWREHRIPQWQWLVSEFVRKVYVKLSDRGNLHRSSDGKFQYLNPTLIGEPMLRKDVKQLARQEHARIAAARRNNYQMLDTFFSRSQLGRPLFPNLGLNDVPYVYPFILKKADYFDLIRNMAIPLYRWEEICPSGCETSDLYRSLLIQFPCHQDLVAEDIERLIAKLMVAESTLQ
jgi:perosamine synthetase